MAALNRDSRPEVFCKKGVLKKFIKFTEKDLCQSLFFNKVETLAQAFSCELCENFKNIFFIEHLRWLLLSKTICIKFFFLLFTWLNVPGCVLPSP